MAAQADAVPLRAEGVELRLERAVHLGTNTADAVVHGVAVGNAAEPCFCEKLGGFEELLLGEPSVQSVRHNVVHDVGIRARASADNAREVGELTIGLPAHLVRVQGYRKRALHAVRV